MTRQSPWALVTLLFGLGLGISLPGGAARAEDDPMEADAVRSRTTAFVKALAGGDAKAVAAFFTPGGEYVREGGTVRGRETLEKAYADHFGSEGKIVVAVESAEVRMPSRDTAIEQGRFLSKDGAPSGFSVLWVREDGQWQIALLRESPEPATLAELDWLVGNWHVEREGAKVRTTYEKVHDGAFLRMQYTVEADGETKGGSQMVGVDAATGTIRSWLFNGDGGHGTGVWTRQGRGWAIQSVGRTADGGTLTAVNVITPIDADSFTFQATQQTIDGDALEDGEAITVQRVE